MKHITTIIALLILCFANVQAQKILKPKWSTPHVGTAAHFNNSGTKLLTRGGNSIDVWDNKADTLLYSFTNPSQITNANFYFYMLHIIRVFCLFNYCFFAGNVYLITSIC